MGSDKSHLEYVMDQIASAGEVTARAMFGEYGIYCDGKICALFCDNKLFVKPTEPGRAFIKRPVEAPPYPGAKLYYLIEEKIDDRRWVSELIRITADALPAPKPRTPKPKSKPVAGFKPSGPRSPQKKSTPPKRGRTAF